MRINIAVLLFSLVFFLTGFSIAGQNNEWIKLGIIPYKSPREVVRLYSPIASILSKTLNKKVMVVTADGYEQYMQRVYEKKYDIIALGSTFYFKAHDKAGYQAVARGYPSFRCGIIVRNDSNINNIEELRGKSMAAVTREDRGGYKLQKKALLQAGIIPEQDIKVHFRNKHDSVVYAVLNGQDDAGAIRLDALQKGDFAKLGKKLKIIYTSPENPQFPFAVRQDMDPSMRDKIEKSLTSINSQQPESATLLKQLQIRGIEQISSEKLDLLRQARKREE